MGTKGTFKKGFDSRRTGGVRDGAGRPPDWLKTKCRELVEKNKLTEWLADVASGAFMERHSTESGISYEAPASVKDRMRAIEMLQDRGWGKAAQAVELSGRDGESLPVSITVKILGKVE